MFNGDFDIINLGQVEYQTAHQLQLKTVEKVILQKANPTLILCSHPPVVTLGKRMKIEEVNFSWEGAIIQVERGGQATYHGPGQCILYPIIPLQEFKLSIEKFLNILEESIIETLAKYEINARGNPNRGNPKYTGVWVGENKIASIGIALKKWVSFHGTAINLYQDPLAFKGISPCGFNSNIMTNLEKLTNEKVPRKEFEQYLTDTFSLKLKNLFVNS